MTKAAELAKMGEVLTNSQIGGRRNLIINGAMQVAQRATSSTDIGGSSGYFTCDRWHMSPSGTAGRLTMTQDSSAPSGFANSIKLDCTTADTSIASGEFLLFTHKFEGQDVQSFAKGTSDAKQFSLSFYVKGNASATYVAELMDEDNSNRHVNKSFSVTTNWTRVELLFPADTTGTLDDDNALSLSLNIWLHAGSDFTSGSLQTTWGALSQTSRAVGISSFFSSTDNTFFITGVQLEVSSQATPFEHRSFGEELALCQRYFQKYSDNGSGGGYITNGMIASSRFYGVIRWVTTMRAIPTVAGTSGDFNVQSSANSASGYSIDEQHNPTVDSVRLRTGSNSNLTNGQGAILRFGEAGSLTADSEL
jgi:hypothetical protein